MQVSVENTGPLERVMKVEVPEEKIATEVDSRLQSMTRTTRVQGFRPGKVPLKVIKQRYATQVRQEVVSQVVQSSFYEAVTQENLKLAGNPMIDPLSAEQGQGLSYTAKFEVLPEVTLKPVAELKVEKPACEISDDDVEKMIGVLRQQRREPQTVERAAKDGDVVNIDFTGTVDGEEFEGGSGEGMDVEIGSNRLIEGFESGLIDKKADDEASLELTFPEQYHKEELSGKPVTFAIKVNSVAELVEPELNEEFFAAFGVTEGGEEAFRKEINQHMERERETALRSKTRDAVMKALVDANEVELPKSLVDQEIHRMQHQFTDNLKAQGIPVEDPHKMAEPGLFEEQARQRVALQLLVAEVISENELKASPEKVRSIIEKNAASYEDPSAMINWFYSDEKRLAEVESIALEDAVIDWLLENADVSESNVSFDELMNKGQTD